MSERLLVGMEGRSPYNLTIDWDRLPGLNAAAVDMDQVPEEALMGVFRLVVDAEHYVAHMLQKHGQRLELVRRDGQ